MTQRPSARTPWQHWYWSQRWRRKAKAQLAAEPCCRMCEAENRVTEAKVADHIIPHRGDVALFWSGKLQSLCPRCHSSTKQREERGRFQVVGEDGWPISGGGRS